MSSFGSRGKLNYLRAQDCDAVAEAVQSRRDIAGFSRVVSIGEIEAKGWTLNVSAYVGTAENTKEISVNNSIRKLRKLEASRAEAEDMMNRFLEELGYGP